MQSRVATIAILAMTAIWGSTFFLTKDLLTRIDAPDYLGVRFTISTLALALVANRRLGTLSRAEWGHGAVMGAIYGVSQLLQTAGLARISASTSGFVTGMYVVFTPLVAGVLFRQRIGRWVWAAVALSTVGLGFISLRGLAVGAGELLTLASALGYAFHILATGRWSTRTNALPLTAVQMAVNALICLGAASLDGVVLPSRSVDWVAMLYLALAAGALAMLLQTWAQARVAPTRAAVIMTMEPVFATLFAVLFGNEHLTVPIVIGGLFVLAAMYLVELSPKAHGDEDDVVLVPEVGMAGTLLPDDLAADRE